MILQGAHRPDLLRHETLADLLADTVRRQPDALAIVDGSIRLSYSELWLRSRKVAHALASRG